MREVSHRRCLGPTFVARSAGPDLVAAIQWGALDVHGIRGMISMFDFIRCLELAASERILLDCRDVQRVDGQALRELLEQPSDWLVAPSLVVVLPAGIPGILLAGGLSMLAQRHPPRFVRDLDAAFALLGDPAARTAHAAAAELAVGALGRSALILRLRAHLARDLVGATVENSAATLGRSKRALQRDLGDLATSFSDELRRARVAAAEELLGYSDLKIDDIGARVGLGNASRLSAVLRREQNLTAKELRTRTSVTFAKALDVPLFRTCE